MSSNSFLGLYRTHTGYVCDKWEQYLAIYDAEIGELVARGAPLNLLEIGVQNGGSLEIWAKLLPPGSQIVGIDIDPYCAELMMPGNVRVLTGDVTDGAFLAAALGDREFDLIIDDGSHRSHDIISAFRLLFPRLRPAGKYFIEDLHASYWSEFGGSFRGEDSAIEFLKSLIDALHTDHFKDLAAADADELAALIALNRQIARLGFFDSLAVIEKYPREKTKPFVRTIAGSQAEISTTAWRNYLTTWSTPLMVFNDEVREVLDADTKREVSRLGHEAANLAGEATRLRSEAARLADESARLEREATGYRAQLAQAETTAGQLREQLAEADRALSRASGRVQDADDKLFEREQELQQVRDQLGVERRRGARIRHELTAMRDKRNALRARLKAVKASWGWRLSWPIRRIGRLWK